MQLISIDTSQVTPQILRDIANVYESTGLEQSKTPIKYTIWSEKDITKELHEDIEESADSARSELDDVVIWLNGLTDLYDIAITELETKFSWTDINLELIFRDIKEYHALIVKHAVEARKEVVSINTTIDPAYWFTALPKYTVIS